MAAVTRLSFCLIGVLALGACEGFDLSDFAAGTSPRGANAGHLSFTGPAPLVPQEGMAYAGGAEIRTLLADHLNLTRLDAHSSANDVSMMELCDPNNARPEFVLLTRSPSHNEVLRCERAGFSITADLMAVYKGEWIGFAQFDQAWIAYIPETIAQNPAARRAVETLRYEFGALIEGTEYAEVFEARRG